VNISSSAFSLGPEECVLPGSVNVSSNTFSLEPEECLLPGSVNVSTTSFSIFKSGDEQSRNEINQKKML
jgi:hypothetical protein